MPAIVPGTSELREIQRAVSTLYPGFIDTNMTSFCFCRGAGYPEEAQTLEGQDTIMASRLPSPNQQRHNIQ